MTDDQLRALVRDAVARHLAPAIPDPARAGLAKAGAVAADATALPAMPMAVPVSVTKHHGFHRYLLPRPDGDDGRCLIEPAVRCNHCGFCESHGY
jgi:hypothetical protein